MRMEVFERERERPKEITLEWLWGEYRKEKAGRRVAENMEFSGKPVLAALGSYAPDQITARRCEQYIAERRKTRTRHGQGLVQDGTIWTEMNHLQIVLNWARKRRLVSETVTVVRPPKPPPRDVRLTREQGKRLIESAAQDHIKLAIALMLGTGARSGAILDLTWDRVDLERSLIYLADPDDQAPRKGRATVRMNDDLKARMTVAKKLAGSETGYVIEWGGKKVGSIKKGFAKAVADAGLSGVTPHVLRHSAATWMAEAGVPMDRIAQFLGHSDPAITFKVYARFSPEYQREAADALDLSGVPLVPSEPVNTKQLPKSSNKR